MKDFCQKLIWVLILSVVSLSASAYNYEYKAMRMHDDDQGYMVTLVATYTGSRDSTSVRFDLVDVSNGYTVLADCHATLPSNRVTFTGSGKSGYTELEIDGNWECTINDPPVFNVSAQCEWDGGLHVITIGKVNAKIGGIGSWVNAHAKTIWVDAECLVNIDGLQLEGVWGEIELITETEKDNPQSHN